MGYRQDVARAAIREWERHQAGRPDTYERAVLRPDDYPNGGDWCGLLALWVLQQAGLAKGVKWVVGHGFISPLHLPVAATPEVGDILYVPQPFQHQAIVVAYEPTTGMVTSIDGNQPDIEPRVRFVKNGNIQFYSIQPLIDQAEREAPFWPYALAGAAILGVSTYLWFEGTASLERQLKRLGI